MKQSHSRETYPYDKPVPLFMQRLMNSTGRKVLRKMQNNKQRTYNKELCKNY